MVAAAGGSEDGGAASIMGPAVEGRQTAWGGAAPLTWLYICSNVSLLSCSIIKLDKCLSTHYSFVVSKRHFSCTHNGSGGCGEGDLHNVGGSLHKPALNVQ